MLLRLAAAAFLILHGSIHLGWATPQPADPNYPFRADRAWIVSSLHMDAGVAKSLLATIAVVTVVLYAVAGIGLLLDAGWWKPFALVGSATSITVLALSVHPWLVLGFAIDAAIIASVVAVHLPAALFE